MIISVAPAVPPASVHQCLMLVPISATYHCPSELPFSVTHQYHQCRLSVPSVLPSSAIYQCHVSVLPFSAHQ
ncbi:unnamed protein product [Staurois parvus]|uniref:Uncharacterized protein n=1 Tax=Staurois parvus TaxID=386267 RepID=A0ABN9F9A9_9NEOB|nr:unnamed protein product [Staurois parvus]